MRGKNIPSDVIKTMYQQHTKGKSVKELSEMFAMKRNTIYNILKRVKNESKIKEKPKTGRPRKISDQSEWIIERKLKENPNISTRLLSTQLKQEYGIEVSHETIRQTIIRNRSKARTVCQRRMSADVESDEFCDYLTPDSSDVKEEDTTSCEDGPVPYENTNQWLRTVSSCGSYKMLSNSRSSSPDGPVQLLTAPSEKECTFSESEMVSFENAMNRPRSVESCELRSKSNTPDPLSSDTPIQYLLDIPIRKRNRRPYNKRATNSFENCVKRQRSNSDTSSSESSSQKTVRKLFLDTTSRNSVNKTNNKQVTISLQSAVKRQRTNVPISLSSTLNPLSKRINNQFLIDTIPTPYSTTPCNETLKQERISCSPTPKIPSNSTDVFNTNKVQRDRCYACGQLVPKRVSRRDIKPPLKYLMT